MIGDIFNRQGEQLDYVFHTGKPEAKDLVILGHGVTGNKDRLFLVKLAEALAAAGIPALRFSFSGNGNSDGNFADSTISKEVEDLGTVIDAAKDFRVTYVGHSMGGAVGVIRASRDERIRRLVSLAGMVHTKAFAQREFGQVKVDHGFMWDDEECPLSKTYMDDLTTIDNLLPLAAKIHVPWLLVHGTNDDVVPIEDSREIFALANEPKELVELDGCNHVFAEMHVLTMVKKVVTWLTEP